MHTAMQLEKQELMWRYFLKIALGNSPRSWTRSSGLVRKAEGERQGRGRLREGAESYAKALASDILR